MLVAVAAGTRASVRELLDEPLWLLLYTFLHLREADERRALDDRLARVDLGFLTAKAHHDPAQLADELRDVHRAIDAFEHPERADVSDLREKALAMIARAEERKAALDAQGIQPTVEIIS